MPKGPPELVTPSRIFILLMLAVGAWLWLDVLKSEAAGATSIYGAPCGRNCQYGCCRADQCVQCGDEEPPPIQPPGISGVLNCSGGAIVNGWCTTSLSLDLTAWDPYGSPVMIFGKVNGVDYSCPYGATTCSVPLTAEGTGTASYRVTSGTGQTSGEYTVNYQLDRCLYHRRWAKIGKRQFQEEGKGKSLSNARGSRDQEAIVHARPSFVPSNGAGTHFHATDGSLGGIVGPGHARFGLEGAVTLPGLA